MKTKLITITLILTSISLLGQSVSKSELKNILKETLTKSRDYVSGATNSWFYNNSQNDYKIQDTLTFSIARNYKINYCKIVNWTFSKWNSFRLEFADYCEEPPIKSASNDNDYYEFIIEENDDIVFVLLKNVNGIQDKFKVIELTENELIDSGNYQFDYTIKLKRIK